MVQKADEFAIKHKVISRIIPVRRCYRIIRDGLQRNYKKNEKMDYMNFSG